MHLLIANSVKIFLGLTIKSSFSFFGISGWDELVPHPSIYPFGLDAHLTERIFLVRGDDLKCNALSFQDDKIIPHAYKWKKYSIRKGEKVKR